MTVVAPTGGRVDIKNASAESNGVFFGVAKGVSRPFREPGLDIRDLNASPDKDKWKRDLPRIAGLRLKPGSNSRRYSTSSLSKGRAPDAADRSVAERNRRQ